MIAWLWPVVHWGVFGFGACVLIGGVVALLLDGFTRGQYQGASSYRRDERQA